MNPIPRNAQPSDPCWEREFLDLAHGLVMAGAKTKLIIRFTGLAVRKVRSLYKGLRGIAAPAGPIVQGAASYFATRGKRISAVWSVQCATFLGCYERVGLLTEQPLHRGWQLLASFNTYLSFTESLSTSAAIKRLDINQAYLLLTHCEFLENAHAPLQRRECPQCLILYLVAANLAPESQYCPVCFMDSNTRRLARQALPAAEKGVMKRRR